MIELEHIVPDLRKRFEQQPLDLSRMIRSAVAVEDTGPPTGDSSLVPAKKDRGTLLLTDGSAICEWNVDSLRALFRGDKTPPDLGDYPGAYQECMVILEMHVLEYIQLFGEPRDKEMEEIYSALRRRPDGRSLGDLHDYMWQAAAIMLGIYPLSQAEYEAILARLERSCRTFQIGPTSRNYVQMAIRPLQSMLDSDGEDE